MLGIVKISKKFQFKRFFLIQLIALITLTFANESAMASSAAVTWTIPTTNSDKTPLTDLAGYKIYVGTASGIYNAPIDVGLNVGNPPTYTINNLKPGTYYFVVTSYVASGLESSPSNEISKTVASDPISTGAGCGMIIPKDDVKSFGPGQAVDMLCIVGLMVIILIRKLIHSFKLKKSYSGPTE